MTASTDQRYDHYYALQDDHEIEEGHIFCTIAEGEEILARLREALPDVKVWVEAGGLYNYTTEDGSTAEIIADDIVAQSGFVSEYD